MTLGFLNDPNILNSLLTQPYVLGMSMPSLAGFHQL